METVYIDLDLPSGTKWAVANDGAVNMDEYGNFYKWCETVPSDNGGAPKNDWSKYMWGSMRTYKDAGTETDPLFATGKFILPEYMYNVPTAEDWKELREHADWEWYVTYNDIRGYVIKSRKPPHNFIFLPAAGMYNNDEHQNAPWMGIYWTSDLGSRTYYAKMVCFDTNDWNGNTEYFRNLALPVRRVERT